MDARDKKLPVLRSGGRYVVELYNGVRTHRALNQDSPIHRAVQRTGAITSRPVLRGLHHQYCRV
jgi:hypothetical protein